MPSTKTSAFITGGKTRFFGTSLGSPGGGELPNSAMYWPSTVGWPGTDLANFQRNAAMWGRNPDSVRLYSSNIFATSGVSGSAGAYGFFSNDWRDIANTGCILVITWKYDPAHGSNYTNWGTVADSLNAAGTNAIKTDFNNFAQNLKRWHDDTGNSAPIKKIILGPHHEPSNDGGVAADYKRYSQAAFNYLRTVGVSDGPKPATGPGSAYTGTWYDMLEWCFVDINANFATGTPAASNAGNYYPGDGYCRWVFADGYNWAGGQVVGGGQAQTDAQTGKVPQVGRTITGGHYTDQWKSAQTVYTNNFHQWYAAGPGGFRDVLLGFGEMACSEDIDRFTISGGSLANPQTHTGIPHLKGDWMEGARKWLRGETWTAPDAVNNVVAANIGFGPLIIMPIWWNSQAAGPRWWNTIPFQTGDTTGPSTSGAGAHYTFDKFVTLVTDSIFTTTPVVHTAPTITGFTGVNTSGATGLDFTFTATAVAGDSAIVSYTYDYGDGTSDDVNTSALLTDTATHSYATVGTFTVTLTVTDTNALVDTQTTQVVPFITGTDAVTAYAAAPLIQAGDNPLDLRFTYNPAIQALEDYTALGNATRAVSVSGSAQTLLDPRLWRFQHITLSASCTVTIPTAVPGMILRCSTVQAASGGPYTVTFAAATGGIKWTAGSQPTQSTTASTVDSWTFHCMSAGTWHGTRTITDAR